MSDLSSWINFAKKSLDDIWPSPETIAVMKKESDSAAENFYKLQETLMAKGSDVKDAFLAFPATKAVLDQVSTALDSVEGEAHKAFCKCMDDPTTRNLAIQFQNLNKQTSQAWENVLAHPNAVDAKAKYEDVSRQTAEAYVALIDTNSEARFAANTLKNAIAQCESLCSEHPVLCGLLAAALVEVIFPGTIPSLLGFCQEGPAKRTLAAWVQSTLYGAAVPKGSPFSTMQRRGMEGVTGGPMVLVLGGPVAALLLLRMKRDWSLEGCEEYSQKSEV